MQLDFLETDIREVASQILGNILHLNYSIDQGVHGTATLHTAVPIDEAQLLPILQALLAQNGATLVISAGVYYLVPLHSAVGIAGGPATAGSTTIPLQYVSADDLAKVLTPYAQGTAHIIAVPHANAIIISGEPAQRDALEKLIKSFDVDVLAGQSYALFPAVSGNTEDLSQALQQAFRAQQGGQLAGLLQVVPMPRVGAVLVIAQLPRYVDDARRVYSLIERSARQIRRTWHVYYVQNSTANDVAFILQQAFTPNDVTAQPSSRAQGRQGLSLGISSFSTSGGPLSPQNNSSGSGSGGAAGPTGSAGLGSGLNSLSGGLASVGQSQSTSAPGISGSNPLLGGLTNGGGAGNSDQPAAAIRIVPNPENNAILLFSTGEEEDTIEAMLHKIDILPLQVRVDVIIAEVDLTNQLAYGTQFYFTHHGIQGAFNQAAQRLAGAGASGAVASSSLGGGFVFNASGAGGDIVLSALQGITSVRVLSSPELLVLDNETAQLQVGNLVPYLSAQTTVPEGGILTSGLLTSNTVNYYNTGVITSVTPRVNSGGLVTLDISQQVSSVAPNSGSSQTSGSSINSPTFQQRALQTRVVVQDSQTVGLAGLISDSVSRQNAGIPFLKDIPIISLLASNQVNQRSRTELLILLTPHVLHDQREARALTEDLREHLPEAAFVQEAIRGVPHVLSTRSQ